MNCSCYPERTHLLLYALHCKFLASGNLSTRFSRRTHFTQRHSTSFYESSQSTIPNLNLDTSLRKPAERTINFQRCNRCIQGDLCRHRRRRKQAHERETSAREKDFGSATCKISRSSLYINSSKKISLTLSVFPRVSEVTETRVNISLKISK